MPAKSFNAREAAAALHSAISGFGTDEKTIIDILTSCCNAQRQEIADKYSRDYGNSLIEDIKGDLGGDFEDVMVALMKPTAQFISELLHEAMSGMGTDETLLVELLCPRTNEEIAAIVASYQAMYNRPLAEDLCGDTSGHFRRLLTFIVTGNRDPEGSANSARAKEQAQQLYNAGEGQLGTDEEVFNRILAHNSFDQLRLVFDEYTQVSGQTIEQAIASEMSDELQEAMMAIGIVMPNFSKLSNNYLFLKFSVECAQSTAAFFATRLAKAMNGMGTDEATLIRIIVSRSEIDLENIKDEFERMYNKTLRSALEVSLLITIGLGLFLNY